MSSASALLPPLAKPVASQSPNQSPEASTVPRLEVRNLSVSYTRRRALHDVSMSIGDRAITALVGPSGCGKSSFLQTLNRMTDLIPGCRVQGQIRLDGEDITAPETDLLGLRRRVGMIFQKPNPFPLSIHRNFALPLREHGIRDRHQIESRIEGALRDVGLWDEVSDRLHTSATDLSGGQQQRLCIARALALDPEVILLDEPCSALDPISSGVVEDLIASLRNRYTVVVVTHNLPQARRIADHTALFWVVEGAGQLVEMSNTESFFDAPVHELTREYVSGARG